MNHTTLAIVIVLTAALVTGASLAIPLQDAKASSDHQKTWWQQRKYQKQREPSQCMYRRPGILREPP